jgi:hypothetical protein
MYNACDQCMYSNTTNACMMHVMHACIMHGIHACTSTIRFRLHPTIKHVPLYRSNHGSSCCNRFQALINCGLFPPQTVSQLTFCAELKTRSSFTSTLLQQNSSHCSTLQSSIFQRGVQQCIVLQTKKKDCDFI